MLHSAFQPQSTNALPDPSAIPNAMLNASRWLVWKYVQKADETKPRKLPFYVNGGLRAKGMKLDSPTDIAQLVDFKSALEKFASGQGQWAGIGFAIVHDEGIGGIDLDNCLDADGEIVGKVAQQVYDTARLAGCYCEVSPSGKGLRIIGSTAGFNGFNRGGFEAYSGGRYLTITGSVCANPKGFGEIDSAVSLMDQLVPAPSMPPTNRNGVESKLTANIAGGVYVKPNRVEVGGRNDAVLKYASHLRGSGVAEHLLLQVVSDFNKAVCDPPLDESEIDDIVGRYKTRSVSTDAADWPEPKEIKAAMPTVPAFDATMLPTSFQAYVEDTAELMQAPLDYVAVPLIVAAAATIGNSWAIAPKVWDTNWLVTPVLWGGIVGRPGMKKSPAMDKGVVHLKSLEDDMDAAHQLNVQKYATDKIIYDAAVQTAKAAAKAGRQVPTLPPEPKPPEPERLVANDSTYQKLTDILQWSPRGVLVLKDELVGLLESLASDGQEGARAFYLQAWNGNGQYKVDRVGRGSLVIKRLAIWLVGGIQPGKLQTYVRQAVQGGNGDDGLLQRFQLIVWPDVSPNWKNIDRSPDVAAFDNVENTFKYLRSLHPMTVGARTGLGNGPAYLHFTTEAQSVYDSIRGALETSLRKGERHPALESHFAKYPSLLAALALVIHLSDGGTGPVCIEALNKAGRWLKYLGAHAKRVYAVATNGAAHSAKALADKIKTGVLKNGFSAREINRKQWSQLTTLQDVKAAIEWLVDTDWLKEVDERAGSTGKVTYVINPRVFGSCQ